MTLAKGAALKEPSGLFNSSLDGNTRRAICIHEGDKVDEAALKDLIRAGVALSLKGKIQPKPHLASSKPTSFIAGPGHISSHWESPSAPASYPMTGVQKESQPPAYRSVAFFKPSNLDSGAATRSSMPTRGTKM